MTTMTDVAESYAAIEKWAKLRENEDLGGRLRDHFLGLAKEFLQGPNALIHWKGQCGIPVKESGDHVLVEIDCIDTEGTEWVKVL